MKKTFIIFILTLNYQILSAQYRKMPLDKNHYWQQFAVVKTFGGSLVHCEYMLVVRDSIIINNKTFQYVSSTGLSCDDPFYFFYESAFLRQDTTLKIITRLVNNQERILYNFNKNVGDTALLLSMNGSMQTDTLVIKDSTLLGDGLYHNFFVFKSTPPIIEGVGSIYGLLIPWSHLFETVRKLNCLVQVNPAISIYSNAGVSCPITTKIPLNENRKGDYALYPNPATNECTITSNLDYRYGLIELEIRNVLGELIFKKSEITQEYNLNTAGYVSGIYYVNVLWNNQLISEHKLVIIK